MTLAVPAEAAPDLYLAALSEPSFKVEQVGTTPEHPFYVEGQGWTPAGALKAGDRIVALDGPSLEVIALRLDEVTAAVYNLTIASDASFFVGELGAWGHNNEPTPDTDPGLFEPVKGKPAKRNPNTGEIWEKDRLHKNHYEVYKNKKKYQKGKRCRSVWNDGRLKDTFE